jgi:adenine-specific DNA-methyltransferase
MTYTTDEPVHSYQPQQVARTSTSLIDERVDKMRGLFPEVFVDGGSKLDFERLMAALGSIVETGPEKYSFTWAGRCDAMRARQTPAKGTLVPVLEESVDFATTRNVFIDGENLDVLKLLYRPYSGRIKLVFIDPPYNTGQDYIFEDDYAQPLDTYLKLTNQRDAEGNNLTSKPQKSGRYHSKWLSMMYPRLSLAHELLREDGAIFITIGDQEVYNLRFILNEIFGEENFIANIVWQKKQSPQSDATNISDMHDHILVYAKRAKSSKGAAYGWQRQLLQRDEEQERLYSNPDNDDRGEWASADYTCNKTADKRPNLYYPIINPNTGEEVWPKRTRVWQFDKATNRRHLEERRIWWGSDGKGFPRFKRFLSEAQEGVVPATWWDRAAAGDNQEARRELRNLFTEEEEVFDTPKPVRLIKKILRIATQPYEDALVLDFFAGSGTTAQAVLELNREDGGNRRFILVQLPEQTDHAKFPTIADFSKERIRRVIEKLESADEGKLPLMTIGSGNTADESEVEGAAKTLDLGFKVFRQALSNYKSVALEWPDADNPENYVEQLASLVDPLLEGWQPQNLIWEVALKEGHGLTIHIEKEQSVEGQTVYSITDPEKKQHFHMCFDDRIAPDALLPLNLDTDSLFICRNVALDDSALANLTLQCRLKTI